MEKERIIFFIFVFNIFYLWTDGTRMTPEEMRDTVKESRELAEVFRTIADIIEQKILPADWRCTNAESEENDAQPDGNPA